VTLRILPTITSVRGDGTRQYLLTSQLLKVSILPIEEQMYTAYAFQSVLIDRIHAMLQVLEYRLLDNAHDTAY
jgi:hypothetical protein